jgi:hypothetical protein
MLDVRKREMQTQTVETLCNRIGWLVAERQELRRRHASERVLERNRRAIAHSQRELSRALIARHAPALVGERS